MAKKESVNKSEEVRNYLNKNPGAKPKEVLEALKSQGITVSPMLVSNVKARLKKQGGGKPARRQKAASAPARVNGSNSLGSTASQLLIVKEFVNQFGGAEEAKAAIDELVQVQIG